MGYGGPGENLLFVSTLSSVTCLSLPFSHLGLIRSKVKVALLYGKVSVGDREKAVPVVKGWGAIFLLALAIQLTAEDTLLIFRVVTCGARGVGFTTLGVKVVGKKLENQ